MEVKSHLSGVEQDEADKIEKEISKNGATKQEDKKVDEKKAKKNPRKKKKLQL